MARLARPDQAKVGLGLGSSRAGHIGLGLGPPGTIHS